jgi:nitrate/nitrite-specific signal transduction histidine kinase
LDESFGKQTTSFEALLQALAATWQGACDLNFSIEPALSKVIDNDEVAKACLLAITRESVANAAKHSTAGRCDIAVSFAGAHEVRLEIASPGFLSESFETNTGYGTQLMNELASDWRVAEKAGQVVVVAHVQLVAN